MTGANVLYNHPPPPIYDVPGGTQFANTHEESGAPPSYEEAINPNAPPPSYDSLFGRVREAQKSSKGIIDFLKNVIIIVLGTLGCSIILGVTIVIPICMIVMGSIYLHECPQGEYIPVYLLVGGIFGILKQLLHLSARVRQTEEERQEENLRQSPTQTLLNCFMLGWFIIGSVWVYKEYEPNYDPTFGKYCNKNLYLFAFWLITSVYIILGLITLCLCSITVATVAFHTDARDDQEEGGRIW
ncbi:transmembrane protein 272-like [Euwallacea fornicatus]|uniref:transmembrane protein 272-like n=1 Tax=Euwallacea fornicatus TaxID=995702 RepID=UPI00338EF759